MAKGKEKEMKSIATTVFQQSDTELIINACKKQRADGLVAKLGEGWVFDAKVGDDTRPAGDNLYRYTKPATEPTLDENPAPTETEDAPKQDAPTPETPDAPDAGAENETPTAPEVKHDLHLDRKGNEKRTFIVTAGSKEEALAKVGENYPAYEFDRLMRGETDKFRFRKIETTMECTRKLTAECQARAGIFEPKEWHKRQNYRVCGDCQNELNKPYRPTKKATEIPASEESAEKAGQGEAVNAETGEVTPPNQTLPEIASENYSPDAEKLPETVDAESEIAEDLSYEKLDETA